MPVYLNVSSALNTPYSTNPLINSRSGCVRAWENKPVKRARRARGTPGPGLGPCEVVDRGSLLRGQIDIKHLVTSCGLKTAGRD